MKLPQKSTELKAPSADLLEDMSFAEGSAYNEALIPLMRGERLPDRKSYQGCTRISLPF